MKAVPYVVVVCLVFGLASTSWAAASFGVAVMDAAGNIISSEKDVKSPRLRESDTFSVLVDKHFAPMLPPVTNYAGYIVKFHITDGTEVSVLPTSTFYKTEMVTTPMGTHQTPVIVGTSPLDFPQSLPGQSFTIVKSYPTMDAPISGSAPEESKWIPMAKLDLHAKGTTIGQNSDVDMTVMAWCILHINQGQGSTQFRESALVWATSNFQPTPEQPIPSIGPHLNDPNGQWKHIPFTWHLQPGFGSQFVATFLGTVTIGIEHVPEPITGVLAGGGVLLLVCSWGLRRRRMAL